MNKQIRMFFLLIGIVFSMAGWAQTKTSTLTFTGQCGGSGTADNGVKWTVTSDGEESIFDKKHGIHYGTGKAAVEHLTLTTDDIHGTVTKIVVNASGASKTKAQLSVTVGGKAFGTAPEVTNTAADYTFTGSAEGDIMVKLHQEQTTKALYVKSITVTYEEDDTPQAPTFSLPSGHYEGDQTLTITTGTEGAEIRYTTDGLNPTAQSTLYNAPLTISRSVTIKAVALKDGKTSAVSEADYNITHTVTVKTIAELKQQPYGDVTLEFSDGDDGSMARVLYAGIGDSQGVFIRDKTGAVCLRNIRPNVPFEHNQHIAGRISGHYMMENGMPVIEGTMQTNTAWLVIASPVTEPDVTPRVITPEEYSQHIADWIVVKDQHVLSNGKDTKEGMIIHNRFYQDEHQGNGEPYEGAIVDLSGIACPYYGEQKVICPAAMGNIPPVTFIVDENEPFVTPPYGELCNVTVRLKRTLSTQWWNTFCVPFEITDINGITVMEFARRTWGETMVYEPADKIEAGVPYLVKWDKENPTFTGVTLTQEAPKTITSQNGSYSFIGTYGPAELKSDRTERFLGSRDLLYWPDPAAGEGYNRIKGMRAYFRVPAAATGAKVSFDEATAIDSIVAGKDGETVIYNLNGQRMAGSLTDLKKGIYIVNGKKTIIK